ncbi:MAG: hypothetical protein GDA42_04280 [Ekhidna sp.]|nr:hypothetical protein [Ekhidna sp.]
MDLEQLQEKFRKLEESAGKEGSSALLQIIELKMSDFKPYIEQKFAAVDEKFAAVDKKFEQKFAAIEQRFTSIEQRFTSVQWMIGISFTCLSILIVLLKLF